MKQQHILDAISALSPREFENFTYDCLSASGLKNMVWRTPGADGGRDIEGLAYARDLSGYETVQKWYVECKRYASSIDWPTVWEKIAYADVQGSDVLLISTNSNPSPQCETRLSEWASHHRRPMVRCWRGYDLPRLVRAHPHVAAAYGLMPANRSYEAGALKLAFLVTKIAQAAYVASELAVENACGLEAAASLSELLSQRLDDLNRFNRFVRAPNAVKAPSFVWAEILGSTADWEDVGLRALLAFIRYQLNAPLLRVTVDGHEAQVRGVGARLALGGTALDELTMVAHWARAEVRPDDACSITIYMSQRV